MNNTAITNLNTKTIAKINSLYGNAKAMRSLCVIGLLIPIILVVGAVLGLVYQNQRTSLMKMLDGENQNEGTTLSASEITAIEEKLTFLRQKKRVFMAPAIVLGIYMVLLTTITIIALNTSGH